MKRKQKSVWDYIKEYKFNGLFLKNFGYIICIVILPMLVVVSINYLNFSKEANNHMMDMNQELLEKSGVVVDNIIKEMLLSLDTMTDQTEIWQAVISQTPEKENDTAIQSAISILRENTVSNSFLSAVYLYSDVSHILITGEAAADMDAATREDKWYGVYKNIQMGVPYILLNDREGIYVCEQLNDPALGRVGVLVLEMDFQKIRDVLEKSEVSTKGRFFLVDYNGEVVYCSDPKWFTEGESYRKSDKEVIASTFDPFFTSGYLQDKVVSLIESEHQSWCYMLVSAAPVFEEETRATESFLTSSIVVAICTSIIASVIITTVTYTPIRKILDVVRKPQHQWRSANERESNELLYVTSNIINTFSKKEELSRDLNERIKMLREAQFRSLQFQIDPHFLYNTLESIKWCSVEELGLGNRVSKMISKTARFYRVGLENDDIIVTIQQEIEIMKMYAEIIFIRFGDAITFHWNIDESLLECNVIKMCMQPLVENAINHGLRPRSYCGNIGIDVYHDETTIYVAIKNDGLPMDKQAIARMNENLRTGAGFKENAVGLRNVNERIKLIFGEKYGVHIECDWKQNNNSEEKLADTRVIMTFPYVQ